MPVPAEPAWHLLAPHDSLLEHLAHFAKSICTTVGLQCIQHMFGVEGLHSCTVKVCGASSNVWGLERARRINANFLKQHLHLLKPNTLTTWRMEDGGERISATLFDLPIKLVCSQSLAEVIILKTLLFTCGLILEEVD